jgi:hypothetical protein
MQVYGEVGIRVLCQNRRSGNCDMVLAPSLHLLILSVS